MGRRAMPDEEFVKAYGPWAIVTGASSGIGTGYARRLAAKGLNLVLVARREERLDEIARQLEVEHGIASRVAAVDLTQEGFVADLRRVTDPLDVGLLVSNAGGGTMGATLKTDLDESVHTLSLNTAAHLRLVHHYGNRLVGRQRGGIVLLGAMAGMQSLPFGGSYAGEKAYIHSLGQALNYELRNTGVHVSVTVPGATDTPGLTARTDIELSKLPGPVMSVDKLVTLSLEGLIENKPLTVAGRFNRTVDWMGRRFGPRQMSLNMVGWVMRRHVPDELAM